MAKRMFTRTGDVLSDRYVDFSGRTYERQIDVGALQALIPGAPRPTQTGRPGEVDALLDSLENGDISAPHRLLAFLDDPRVRPALVQAARAAPSDRLANFAHAISLIGGDDVAALLRDRLKNLLDDSETFQDATSFNRKASSLTEVTGGLLRLGVDLDQAASVLVKLMSHPSKKNQQTAARVALDVLERVAFPDAVSGVLLRALRGMDLKDPATFAIVAARSDPANHEQVVATSIELLHSRDSWARDRGVRALQRLGDQKARRILLDHLSDEESDALACSIASYLGEEVPSAMKMAIVKRTLNDESPSVRLEAIVLMRSLDLEARRQVAQGALEAEPDPDLRVVLTGLAS